jgi:phage gpG-like protein
MSGSFFDFSQFLNVLTDMDKIQENVTKKEAKAVKLAAQEYSNDVKKVIQYVTGTLRRSIHVETSMEGINHIALVGTNVPYARRLEYGYIDTDSLGRNYHQAPAARWRPTFDNNLRKYEAIIKGTFNRDDWIGG